MLFNSFEFALFFIIVYGLYLVFNHKLQNWLLLVASYAFYGAWDWRFLSLIVISTILDYICGLKIYHSESQKTKKLFLFFSIFGNLGMLGFFKYFSFFASSLQDFMNLFGMSLNARFMDVVLPVGISFYTFQTMSYTIDIYRRELEPTRRFLDFALFVSFFPQLVAGPIERAKRLLPQILAPRNLTLNGFYEGSYLIFWGLFQKVFVADNLAQIVDPIFNSENAPDGATVLLGLYAFAFQIFCDFAGYSNIARGLGKMMGFNIMVNFNLPYFATNPREFWRRWHISLSTWLRDYLYIPLGGNRGGTIGMYKNLTLTMLLGGLWHGAAWTFVFWGAYQGMLLMVHRACEPFLNQIRMPKVWIVEKAWYLIKLIVFFQFVCFGWLLFRAQSMGQVWEMTGQIFTNFTPHNYDVVKAILSKLFLIVSLLYTVQIFQYVKRDSMVVYKSPLVMRVLFYGACLFLMLVFGGVGGKEFIYFQF